MFSTPIRIILVLCALPFLCGYSWSHDPESGQFRGRVFDVDGYPLPEIPVKMVFEGAVVAVTESTDLGWFIFQGLPKGAFDVVVDDYRYKEYKQTITGHVDLLEIRLKPREFVSEESIGVYAAAPRTSAGNNTLKDEELARVLVETPGDVLRAVPGMVVAQHGGGGKSDQYLIRGFDADHGTDFMLFFEGIPVNMVSHAHGQGYADLSFMIPETLQKVEVHKGGYFSEFGNLGTAGTAQMRLRESLDNSFVQLEGASFNSGRFLAGWSPEETTRARGFVMVEHFMGDGPFDSPQDMTRTNLATRWSFPMGDDQQLTLFATNYEGEWNASGQIPLREVESGRMSRFGAIDDTEGGDSSRTNLSVSHVKQMGSQVLKSQVYFAAYDLDLYSNFTFFLNDKENGDGIEQVDDRTLFGGHIQYLNYHDVFGGQGTLTVGADFRQDDIDVGLFRQRERTRLSTVVDSQINERNASYYIQEELTFNHYLRAFMGMRYEQFDFDVTDKTGDGPEGSTSHGIALPKASLILTPSQNHGFNIYLNYGRSFHSNDARSAAADPDGVILAPGDGYEIGISNTIGKYIEMNVAWWHLDLDGELVWVGDEGVTELGGPTRRYGLELGMNWLITKSLYFGFDFNDVTGYDRETKNPIPRAPDQSWSAGFAFRAGRGWQGSLKARGIDDFPLNEDGSFMGQGYTLVDLTVQKDLTSSLEVSLSFENLLDENFLEAQTYFESQLPHEPEPVGDNHFTPGAPFAFGLSLKWKPF
ncbi:MAG: TonB-dependent receptor [Acidobacteriota bacterium]|nr:TonB-dependent receptor [Acidobacteriota bacterium]